MKKRDVINHFGGEVKTAAALGLTRQAVYQWADPIPERLAYQIQVMTGGILRVDPSVYARLKAKREARRA
jgi:hypothetical protein